MSLGELFPIFPFDATVARIYARLWAALAAQDIVVGSHDLIIAATALSMDYVIIIANIWDVGKIEGLKVEKFERIFIVYEGFLFNSARIPHL